MDISVTGQSPDRNKLLDLNRGVTIRTGPLMAETKDRNQSQNGLCRVKAEPLDCVVTDPAASSDSLPTSSLNLQCESDDNDSTTEPSGSVYHSLSSVDVPNSLGKDDSTSKDAVIVGKNLLKIEVEDSLHGKTIKTELDSDDRDERLEEDVVKGSSTCPTQHWEVDASGNLNTAGTSTANHHKADKPQPIMAKTHQYQDVLPAVKKPRRSKPQVEFMCRFKCTICGSVFNDPGSLAVHQNSHIKQKLFICKRCSKFVPVKDQDPHGIRCVCVDVGHCCHVCDESFPSEQALLHHIPLCVNSMNEVMVKCDGCAQFIPRQNRDAHDEFYCKREFKCEKCGRILSTKRGLSNHQYTVHGDRAKKSKCPLCKKALWRLDRHQCFLKSVIETNYTIENLTNPK